MRLAANAGAQLMLLCAMTGYPEYELMVGGSEVSVDKHNVGDYIKAVVRATLHEGIKAQMQAFRCVAMHHLHFSSHYLSAICAFMDWSTSFVLCLL